MKAGYSSLLGFQVQFYLGELSIQDKLELVFNLIDSLPHEAKLQIATELQYLIREKVLKDLDNFLEK